MTLIVAVPDGEGGAVVGADSMTTQGDKVSTPGAGRHKLFVRGDLLMAVTGYARFADMLAYGKIPTTIPGNGLQAPEELRRWFHDKFGRALREELKGWEWEDKEGEVKEIPASQGMIVVAGRVFQICSNYGVEPAPKWGLTIGSGWEVARGAIYALMDWRMDLDTDPDEAVNAALSAASSHLTSVGPPFQVVRSHADGRITGDDVRKVPEFLPDPATVPVEEPAKEVEG